jgi:hypothetical protein
MATRVHVALFTSGYPHVDAAIRAVEIARRHAAGFSRSVGEPLSLRRDQFVRWFLDSNATHALMLEGDVVPPTDALDRLLDARAPIATAAYPQWTDAGLCANVQMPGDSSWSRTIPSRTVAVQRCLLGCVLVTRDALAAIQPPWFLATMTKSRFVTDDEWFAAAAARAGVPIVCDGAVRCAAYRQGADLLALTGGRIDRD